MLLENASADCRVPKFPQNFFSFAVCERIDDLDTVQQLASVAKYAAAVLSRVSETLDDATTRFCGLEKRTTELAESLCNLRNKASVENDARASFFKMADEAARIQFITNEDARQFGHLQRTTRDRFLNTLYEKCDVAPHLKKLDTYRGASDGSCMKFYSDPAFFLEEWKKVMEKEAREKLNKKRGHTRRANTLAAGYSKNKVGATTAAESASARRNSSTEGDPSHRRSLRQSISGSLPRSFRNRKLSSSKTKDDRSDRASLFVDFNVSVGDASSEQSQKSKSEHSSPALTRKSSVNASPLSQENSIIAESGSLPGSPFFDDDLPPAPFPANVDDPSEETSSSSCDSQNSGAKETNDPVDNGTPAFSGGLTGSSAASALKTTSSNAAPPAPPPPPPPPAFLLSGLGSSASSSARTVSVGNSSALSPDAKSDVHPAGVTAGSLKAADIGSQIARLKPPAKIEECGTAANDGGKEGTRDNFLKNIRTGNFKLRQSQISDHPSSSPKRTNSSAGGSIERRSDVAQILMRRAAIEDSDSAENSDCESDSVW